MVRTTVKDATRRLGFAPISVARAFASGLTYAVGLVVGDIENPLLAAAARGVSDVLEERGVIKLHRRGARTPRRCASDAERLGSGPDEA